ncbi:U3 snoRNP protein [Heterostelium album PN500]|uniref:HEAT repeat-containing protein 1 n=1 Tax=Heterostelium pallidum (strain ATCC 26659 / Pp 5 / PN500) TaxID=670386 RepID=D3BAC4_HETP5|nr:U3 snoRNP protein [Heterostelium album PN500]EFA81511.1 U3 snoRNP protein [Heterostelium album PN500]|eukprot:XP_020433628.1 U3 snoRNP protein [Heterostelium album PN500]
MNGGSSNNSSSTNSNNNNSVTLVQEDLLCNIISSIQKCLSFDKDGFLDKQKFEKLLPALVNQLENQMGNEESYKNRVDRYLVPCITQLAITINQEMLWKPMNHAVLMKTRNPYANVKLSAIAVIQSLYKRLGERLLILLPESFQFISELLEDSAPEVEKACQDLVKTIEAHLGTEESISSYL